MSGEEELIARLEKLSGPDREFDGDLMAHLLGWDDGRTPAATLKYAKLEAPAYTASIDSALAMMPPGSRLHELGQWDDNGQAGGWFAHITRYLKTDDGWENLSFTFGVPDPMDFYPKVPPLAANGAIAICIVILKALRSRSSKDGERE